MPHLRADGGVRGYQKGSNRGLDLSTDPVLFRSAREPETATGVDTCKIHVCSISPLGLRLITTRPSKHAAGELASRYPCRVDLRPQLAGRPIQLLSVAIALIGLASLGLQVASWLNPSFAPTQDTHNYVLAGLRLNAGHPLYGYGPGDERLAWLGEAAYPLFSPPLIAVLFRAVVLLPGQGAYIWWAAMGILELMAVLALVWRRPLVTGVFLIPFGLFISTAMSLGNVDCLVVAGLLLTWYLLVQQHDDRAALLIGFLASLKLTPAIFVWWLLVTRRWRGGVVAMGCGIVLALVAMLGSEPLVFVKFYEVTMANLSSPVSNLGPIGIARVVGIPELAVAWLPRALLVTGAALMWATRRRPGLSWAIGTLLMWVGSPTVALHTPALMLVALAPVAWPMSQSHAGRHAHLAAGATLSSGAQTRESG